MSRRFDRSSEAGASLVLVLVALVVFGLLVPVLGQFGSTNGVSGYVVKGLRYDRAAADNGVQAAIAFSQDRRTMGRAHVLCPDITSTMPATSSAFDRTVNVKCQGYDGSGKPTGSQDVPAYAVLALATSGTGIDLIGGGRIKTSGPWFANSGSGNAADIEPTVDATADLFGANGGCEESSGGVIYAAPNRCNSGESVTVPGPVEGPFVPSPVDIPNVPADPPGPAIPCDSVVGGVVTLKPGIHWEEKWLNGLSNCGTVVIWLEPGVHYFDFDFYDPGHKNNRWTVGSAGNSVTLVGGVPNGWNPIAGGAADAAFGAASTSNAVTTAGACDLNQPGVELEFGSHSALAVESPARAEICPMVPSSGQHLAVSGPASGAEGASVPVPPVTPTKAIPDGGGDDFSWPPAPPGSTSPLVKVDCDRKSSCPADRYIEGELKRGPGGGSGEATVTMQVPNPFARNARLDKNRLTLTVSHQEVETDGGGDGGGTKEQIQKLSFDVNGLGRPFVCDDLPASDEWKVATVQCTSSTDPAPLPDPKAASELTVVWHITTNQGDRGSVKIDLDHLGLGGAQTLAAVRKQAGGNALEFDNGGSGGSAAAFVWGTVYLPTADVTANLGGRSAFRLERGVIANTFTLENAPDDPAFVPVSLPGGGIYDMRTVEYEALISGKTKLLARVEFPDPVGDPGQPPKIRVWDTHP